MPLETQFWQISPGRKERKLWSEFSRNNIMAIGWDDLGDLREYSNIDVLEKEIRRRWNEGFNSARSCWYFSRQIKKNDIIVAKYGASKEIYGIGKVTKEYDFKDEREIFKHVIRVHWYIKFDDSVKVDTSKEFVQWTVHSLSEKRYLEIKKSILRDYPDQESSFLMMETGESELRTISRNWWLEKTIVKGRSDRETGEYSLGKVLWSPQKDRRGADIYKNMREVKEGDAVLHLVDNRAIVGISIIAKECSFDFFVPRGTRWDNGTGKKPGYLITLKEFKPLRTPIHRNDFFHEKYREQLIHLINEGYDVFYRRNLILRQGAYLTEVPHKLLEIFNEIYKKKTGEELPYLSGVTLTVQPLNLQPSLVKTKLMIDENILGQVCAILNSGSHIIITGPVGTGKTSLTEDVCRAAKENDFCDGYVLTTASSDWTTFDTIGGYMPTEKGKLRFEEGKFLEAIRENKWLIIDEINRADIDKAFGQLFTVLSGQRVELPFKHSNGKTISIDVTTEDGSYFDDGDAAYKVGRNWRIIATMNVYDMNFLYEMSYAFMRRFAFVYLDVPEKFEELIDRWCEEKKISGETKEKLKELTKLTERKMGPAIVKDIVKYMEYRGNGEKELAEAIVAYILPQLEGLERDKIEKIWEQIGNIFDERNVPNRIIRPILREIVGIELKEIPE